MTCVGSTPPPDGKRTISIPKSPTPLPPPIRTPETDQRLATPEDGQPVSTRQEPTR